MLLFRLAVLLLSLLGILPFYNAKTKTLNRCVPYSIFWITVDISALLYSIYTILTCNHDGVLFLMAPLISGTIFHGVVVCIFTFRKNNVLQAIVDIFNIVDNGLPVPPEQLSRQAFAIITFTVANATFWPFIVDDVSQPVSFGVPRLLILAQTLQCYASIVFPWFVNCLLSAVHVRLSKLTAYMIDKKTTCVVELKLKIRQISKLHVQLCDLVDILNDLFGWFFLYYFCMSFFCIIIVIIYLRYESNFSLATCFQNGIVIFGLMFQEVITAYTSEHIAREGVQFVANCHRSMVHYEKLDEIRHEFQALAQQGHVRTPVVSAAGFFNNNYAMLYMLANVVATYVVVVIQLQI